jgi:hypothetical protein
VRKSVTDQVPVVRALKDGLVASEIQYIASALVGLSKKEKKFESMKMKLN